MRRRIPLVTESAQGYTFTRRAMVLGAGQMGVAALLAGRMAWLSIAENDRYELLAESNRVQMILIPPRRGWIVDRHGQPIAINRSDFRVDIIPDRLEQEERVIDTLARLLELPPEEVRRIREDLAQAAGYQPVEVAASLPYEQFAAVTVRLPELPGVSPLRSFARYYPDGAAVGHLVGYVGTPNREEYLAEDKNSLLMSPGFKLGKQGIEKVEEDMLRGKPGAKRVEVTARGRLVRELSMLPDRSGGTLKLTIDAGLQGYAARRLGPESGSVVVLDVDRGDILTLASMPSYDPNSFSDGIGHDEWDMMAENERLPLLNKALQALYPPGSTVKPMMALALLEAGIGPEQQVVCGGSYRVGNRAFRCWRRGGHGAVDMNRAVAQSCDVYFYHMGLRIGIDAIATAARKLGMGERFPLPVTSQHYGTVPDSEWKERKYGEEWKVYDTVNTSIGQGYVLANPLQLAVMSARIASGRRIRPRLVMDTAPHPAPPLDFAPEHLEYVRQAMSDVVNGNGTAGRARLPFEDKLLAGKTGTAQVVALKYGSGGQDVPWKYRDHGLFIAFAPLDKPRYAAAVVIQHGGGSGAAYPVARDVITFLYDKDKAMESLLPLEESWGGTIAER
ncbi:MAG: penicillin-binding protein 2, partial [Sphingomonadaceae bacterium]